MNQAQAKVVLVAQLSATLYLVGLIWMVQIVHYPLFALIDAANYIAYQEAHMARISWIVGPAMLIEAATVAYLLFNGQPGCLSLKL